MTDLQYQLVEAKQQMDAAPHGSTEWLYWGREHMRLLNERQKEMYNQKYFPVQFDNPPDVAEISEWQDERNRRPFPY